MDIRELLTKRGVPFVESGPNVKQGWIGVKCPWCGPADPSEHMGIHLETGKWSCWRNVQHRGPRLHGLLMKLFHCSREAAQALLADDSDLKSVIERLEGRAKVAEVKPPGQLKRYSELETLSTTQPWHDAFIRYLERRDFHRKHLQMLIGLYDLRVALTGKWTNRIVFPVRSSRGRLLGYTGRCIDNGSLRYLSDPGDVVKQNILWANLLQSGGSKLYIVEGQFDALKIDFVSRFSGSNVRATCTFGVKYLPQQLECIRFAAKHFDRVCIMFDPEAMADAFSLRGDLADLNPTVENVPDGVEDPGELSWGQVLKLGD